MLKKEIKTIAVQGGRRQRKINSSNLKNCIRTNIVEYGDQMHLMTWEEFEKNHEWEKMGFIGQHDNLE